MPLEAKEPPNVVTNGADPTQSGAEKTHFVESSTEDLVEYNEEIEKELVASASKDFASQ